MSKLWIAAVVSSLILLWGASYALAECSDLSICQSCGFKRGDVCDVQRLQQLSGSEAAAKRRPPEEPKSSGIGQQEDSEASGDKRIRSHGFPATTSREDHTATITGRIHRTTISTTEGPSASDRRRTGILVARTNGAALHG